MRITEFEADSIKKCFHKIFGDGEIYLFGSRTDDSQKGGDIDLYVKPKVKLDLYNKKIRFLTELKQLIEDQKIDVVLAVDAKRIIEKEAKITGQLL